MKTRLLSNQNLRTAVIKAVSDLEAAIRLLKDILIKKHGGKLADQLIGEAHFFAWVDTFATTAGPRGGAGGCAITQSQTFAFDLPNGERIKINSGVAIRWKGVIGERW